MIDIHCHIIPGVDDGARDIAEAAEMARMAFEDGVRHIIATPHFNSNYRVEKNVVVRKVRELQKELDLRGIAVAIHPGNEVRLEDASQFYRDTENGSYCRLDQAGAFILLEQPWSGLHPDTPAVIEWLCEKEITPIIPHPERHVFFRDDPALLTSLIRAGAWTQVSVDSLLARNNEEAQRFAFGLIERDEVHTLATDAHNVNRKPNLSHGFRIVAERAGAARAERIRERMERIIPIPR